MPKLNANIQNVTVFIDRARVTREGTLTLESGRQTLEIPELPLQLIPDSVRAVIKSEVPTRLISVDVRKTFYREAAPGTAKKLLVRIKKLEEEYQAQENLADTTQKEIEQLDGLAQSQAYAKQIARGSFSLDQLAALLTFIREQRNDALARRESIRQNQRELNNQLEKLNNELKQINTARPRERYSAFLDVDVTGDGDVRVELIYMMQGASWKPVYDMRLHDDQLAIDYLAEVRQRSGENWEGVNLTLSTAKPASPAVIPELNPWYLAPRPQRPPAPSPRMRGGAVPEAAAFSIAESAMAPPPMMDAEVVTADIETEGASVQYTIPETVRIPGSNEPHKVTITTISLASTHQYVTAPAVDAQAYRKIEVVNTTPYLLLGGTAQIFEADEFIGRIPVKTLAKGQTLELYFGVDLRISVERELMRRDTDKKFIGDRRRVRYGYAIKLENQTDTSQTITVLDQIPVSRHEDIRIKLDAASPSITDQDALNRLTWDIQLDAGAKKTIEYEFSIEHPRDMDVMGMP